MHRLKHSSAALLLAVAAALSVLPFAVAVETPHGCHCVVRMQCCEDGTCTMGDSEPPATGPEWRTCRREQAATSAPIVAFERALTQANEESSDEPTGTSVSVNARRARLSATIPATPPPRLFSF